MSDDKFKRLAAAIDDFITEEQLKTLRETEWGHGRFREFAHAIQQAASKRLHPMRGHVYPRDQWLKDEKREKLLLGVKVDGLRHIAERSGEYAGQRGPFWYDEEGTRTDMWLSDEPPAAALVEILRHDFEEPMRGIARWEDYAPYKKSGDLFYMWAEMGPHMLAKCAEANGHRKAFQVGDLYIEAELHRDRLSEATASGATAEDPRGEAPGEREPASPREETERDKDKLNEAFGLGGNGEAVPAGDDAPEASSEAVASPEAESEPESGRTPGPEQGDQYQEDAREATEERAQTNGAPDRTISTGEESQLNLLFAKGVHDGPFTKKALKKMIYREFGVESLSDLLARDFDRALELAQDEGMASNYIGDPDTKNMEFDDATASEATASEATAEEELSIDLKEAIAEEWDVTETERQRLVEAYEQADTTLAQLLTLEQRVAQAAAWLLRAEAETPARFRVIAEAARQHGVEPIPEDFPHRSRLLDASIATLQQAHDALRNARLSTVNGLGEKRINDIAQAIGHYDFDVLPVQAPTGEPEDRPNDPAFADGTDDEDVPFA
jgi:hypothetical protein